MQKRTIAVLVNDQPRVLQRVSGLFGRRGFNIESITVGASEEPGLSRMIVVTTGDDNALAQLAHQLAKLVEVIQVTDLSHQAIVARELALVKVNGEANQRPEIIAVIEAFRAAVIDIGPHTLTVQVLGESDKIDAMIELLKPYGIRELCRTGVTAMARGGL